MSIIIFIVVLLLLVLVHEFGHFIVAKKAGIRVDEFAFGFPPNIWSWKKGETTYALNALPLGGYVKIYGENPNDVKPEDGNRAQAEQSSHDGNRAQAEQSSHDGKRSFIAQPRIVQATVIVAGIFFNLLFAWLLFAGALMIGVPAPEGAGGGYPVKNLELVITGTVHDSPAELAGLASGDVLKKLSDGVHEEEVANADQVIAFISPREGQPITLSYKRENAVRSVVVVPASGIVPDVAAIGISMDTIGTLQLPPHVALSEGARRTYQFTVMTVVGITQFLGDAVTGRSDFADVAGPVGIVRQVGEAAGFGFSNLLLFTALISVNLAVINIIPFPALDGGRLLFIVVEGIIRRPIAPAIANSLNAAGFALLMLLMVVVTYHDVLKLVHV